MMSPEQEVIDNIKNEKQGWLENKWV
jgi:hypothetical protein